MTKNEIITKLKQLKPKLTNEGFIILGIFGSYARGEETRKSDLDILYELNETFIKNYQGFTAFSRLNRIKQELQDIFGIEVDIAARSGLSRTGKKYILKDLQSV
jgi:hypothetical protein